VMQHLRRLAAEYDLQAVAFDPWHFDVAAQFLADEGLPMVPTPQSAERMTQAVGSLYAGLMGGTVTHDEDRAFTRHILDAVPRFNDRGFTLAKGRSRGRIDAAVAASLAVDRAQRTDSTPSVYEERGAVTF
jgi:phage terminase large subunit-like protein